MKMCLHIVTAASGPCVMGSMVIGHVSFSATAAARRAATIAPSSGGWNLRELMNLRGLMKGLMKKGLIKEI